MSTNRKKKKVDYVIGLISGRFSAGRDTNGKLVTVFNPNIANKHLPLPLIAPLDWRTMSDDQIKVNEGLRPPLLQINRSEFQKTSEEKTLLKKLKAENKKAVIDGGFNPKYHLNANEIMLIKRA